MSNDLHPSNLGVKAYDIKGGKISTGTASPVVMAEIARHRAYVAAIASLPPVNNHAAAKACRAVAVKFNAALAPLFRDLNLDY